eukprot:c9430_g1_i1.p1 GENE.c9430_g1_i1~~c9430_g1_i1.p1  ORF type:complete len:273 (+),score=56.83 c9430_g1_i1:26-844(+)
MQEGWGEVSEEYDVSVANFTAKYAAAAVELAELKGTERVLDVGAGTGSTSYAFAEKCASVMATDYAPQMLQILQRKLEADKNSKITTRVADGMKLSEVLLADSNELYDVSVSVFALIFFPDPLVGLKEMVSMTKPGGQVIVMGWGPREEVPAFTVVFNTVLKLFPPEMIDLTYQPYKPLPCSTEVLTSLFENEGLQQIRTQRVVHMFERPNGEAYWRFAQYSPPVRVILSQLDVQNQNKLRDEMIQSLDEQFPNGISLEATAYVTCGIRPSN